MPNPIGVLLRDKRAGRDTLAWARPGLQAPENLTLTTPAFEPGAPIPARYRGRLLAPNVSPALFWTPPPPATLQLALVVQDPDAPRRQAATHALAVGIDPLLRGLGENALITPTPVKGLRLGRGALGHVGWVGPAPVPSHGPHAYVFQLFALDQRLELPEKFGLPDALDAMAGHVLGRARLTGTYEIG